MSPPDLTRFTSRWTFADRRRAAILGAAIAVPVAILGGLWIGQIFTQADTPQYLALAHRQPAAMPFASRQLGPLIVRGLVHAFHTSVFAAFYLEGAVSWVIFFAIALWFLLRSGAPRFMIAASLGMYFWARQFNLLALPDLLYGALLCIFLLLLERRRFLLAALMMFPLTLSRESTILTLACFLVAGWRRLRMPAVVLAIVSMMAGSMLVKRLTADALPNNEHISPMFYLFAKVPWAFLKNILGILPWSNVYPSCEVPRWQMPLHLGNVHAIGLCGFAPRFPLEYLFYLLNTFGLLPLLLFALRRRVPRAVWAPRRRRPFSCAFCLVYGLVSFVLAGLLGESFQRLFEYSWPLFLIALPLLLAATRATLNSNRAVLLFLTLHLALAWMGVSPYRPWLIPVELAFWAAGYVLIRRALVFRPEGPETHTISGVAVTNSPAIQCYNQG